jgi:hypothetical protein
MTAIAPFGDDGWRRGIGVIGCIGHDPLGGQSLGQPGGLRRIALLTCGHREPHRTSQAANGHVDLRAQAAARAAERLIFRPFFRPRGVLMRVDDGGIDDQIFEVRIMGHRLEDPPPNP